MTSNTHSFDPEVAMSAMGNPQSSQSPDMQSIYSSENFRHARNFVVPLLLPSQWQNRVPESVEDWLQYRLHADRAGELAQPLLDMLHNLEENKAETSGAASMRPNLMSPLERYLVVCTSNSPQPWLARQALVELGHENGVTTVPYERPPPAAPSSVAATICPSDISDGVSVDSDSDDDTGVNLEIDDIRTILRGITGGVTRGSCIESRPRVLRSVDRRKEDHHSRSGSARSA